MQCGPVCNLYKVVEMNSNLPPVCIAPWSLFNFVQVFSFGIAGRDNDDIRY